MSCDVAAAAFLFFASASPNLPAQLERIDSPAPASVAAEPLFRDIVAHAAHLRTEVAGARAALAAHPAPMPTDPAFGAEISALATLDQQGSDWLKAHSPDGDLKCILHGIAQDLPAKLAAVRASATPADADAALKEMDYLLRDNVEVITSPPRPAA